ncbi:MAG: hypothetical protein AAF791_09490 [Bacteroidota bacterium]
MRIPARWSDASLYWETLRNYVTIEKPLHERQVTFLVEPPRSGHRHHCTVQDTMRVLEMLPPAHVEWLDLVVFRQPTAKQNALAPVWGRLAYWSEIGTHSGTGIFLDAQPVDLVMKWGTSLRPEDQTELERLRNAGFRVEPHSRGYRIHSTPEAIRASQLFETLPHEVGHYVDYMAARATYEWGGDDGRFWELYDGKPSRDKEAFAHRYAADFRRSAESERRIPFPQAYDPDSIRQDGLDPTWFAQI